MLQYRGVRLGIRKLSPEANWVSVGPATLCLTYLNRAVVRIKRGEGVMNAALRSLGEALEQP